MCCAGATRGDHDKDGEGIMVAAMCLEEICSDQALALSLLGIETEVTSAVQTLRYEFELGSIPSELLGKQLDPVTRPYRHHFGFGGRRHLYPENIRCADVRCIHVERRGGISYCQCSTVLLKSYSIV